MAAPNPLGVLLSLSRLLFLFMNTNTGLVRLLLLLVDNNVTGFEFLLSHDDGTITDVG